MPNVLGTRTTLPTFAPYPFILQQDWDALDQFMIKHASNYTEAWFGCKLGGQEPGSYHQDHLMDTMWRQLKQYRPDIILIAKDHVLIAEVTTAAGPRALGQAILYLILYNKQPLFKQPPRAGIICIYADEDIRYAAQQLKIEIYD
jgi:hypothetical protein